MNYVNLTPHDINLNDGTKIEKSGKIAGIQEETGGFVDGIRQDKLGGVENIPAAQKDTKYIVSMPTLLALRASGDNRTDVVCLITRGKDVKRHPEKGNVISVPGFRTF